MLGKKSSLYLIKEELKKHKVNYVLNWDLKIVVSNCKFYYFVLQPTADFKKIGNLVQSNTASARGG